MTEKINWKEEANSLKEGKDFEDRNWWKATAGQHKIKILSDGEKYTTTIKEKEDVKTIDKVRFEIEINNEKFSWGVTQGITQRSLYGQLVLIGEQKGTLKDEVITLLVKGSGKQVDYTVLEALPLMTAKIEEVVE
jgi:hypothetical protein